MRVDPAPAAARGGMACQGICRLNADMQRGQCSTDRVAKPVMTVQGPRRRANLGAVVAHPLGEDLPRGHLAFPVERWEQLDLACVLAGLGEFQESKAEALDAHWHLAYAFGGLDR